MDPLLIGILAVVLMLALIYLGMHIGIALTLVSFVCVALLRAWERNDFVGTEGVFTVPTWPLRFAVIAGTVIAGMQYLVLVVDRIREVRALRRPAPVETPPSAERRAA